MTDDDHRRLTACLIACVLIIYAYTLGRADMRADYEAQSQAPRAEAAQ